MVAVKRQHKGGWLCLLFVFIRAASAASTRHFTLVEHAGSEPQHPGSHVIACDDDHTHIDTAFHSAGVSADTVFASLLGTHPSPATAAIVEVGVYDGLQCAASSTAGFKPVMCFEPSPANFDRSHATLEAAGVLGNVSLIKKALGNNANQLVKLHSKGGSGDHLGDTPFTGEVEHGFQANEVITMESTSLDAHMREVGYNGDVFIVKIDTQGFDGVVIEGMQGLLSDQRIDYVLFELWPKAMLHGGRKSCNETLVFLTEFGYRLYELAMPGLSVELGEAVPDIKASLFHRGSSIKQVCEWYESKDLSNSFGMWTDVLAVSSRRTLG